MIETARLRFSPPAVALDTNISLHYRSEIPGRRGSRPGGFVVSIFGAECTIERYHELTSDTRTRGLRFAPTGTGHFNGGR